MSDVTALIEEARAVGRAGGHHPYVTLIRRLADALEDAEQRAEEAERERDSAMNSYRGYMTLHRKAAELAAVVEKVREYADRIGTGAYADDDSEWAQGYRQAQRDHLHRMAALLEPVENTEEESNAAD